MDNTDAPKESVSILRFCEFVVFGFGPSWVLASVLFQQISYFQRFQPEGLCISAFMNASINLGFHGLSLFIYLSCGIGGCVGSLSVVVMSPFMSAFDNDYISAFRCGGSGGMFLVSLVDYANISSKSEIEVITDDNTINEIHFQNETVIEANVETEHAVTTTNQSSNPLHTLIEVNNIITNSKFSVFSLLIIIGWTNFNCWGIQPAVIPFAIRSISQTHENELLSPGISFLGLAYSCAGLSLVLGDISTIYIQLPLIISMFLFTMCAFTIYSMAIGCGRFLEAHIVTSIFRNIASCTNISQKMKEYASRAVGISDMICTTRNNLNLEVDLKGISLAQADYAQRIMTTNN
eukprot:gene10632-22197_t